MECRICKEEEENESKFISPCKCIGTQKWIHEECLYTYRTHCIYPNKCTLCNSIYTIDDPRIINLANFTNTNLSWIFGPIPDIWSSWLLSNVDNETSKQIAYVFDGLNTYAPSVNKTGINKLISILLFFAYLILIIPLKHTRSNNFTYINLAIWLVLDYYICNLFITFIIVSLWIISPIAISIIAYSAT